MTECVAAVAGIDMARNDGVTYLVNRHGVCQAVDADVVVTELWRVQDVKRRGKVPSSCSAAIPEAPARGAFCVFDAGPSDRDAGREHGSGAALSGSKGLRLLDAFDTMEAQARKVLFTVEQKQIGRAYSALFEKLDCVGVRCTSIEALSQQSGGGGGEYIDAVLRDRQQLDLWQRRIGAGAALEVRRVRPSKRNTRGLISDRRLVDLVCVSGLTLSEVLRKCGWVAEGQRAQGVHIKALRAALRSSLDRMSGPIARRVHPFHNRVSASICAQQWQDRTLGVDA